MKKTFSILTLVLFTLFFYSCRMNEEAQVKKIAKEFLVYLNTNDYSNAKRLGTEETKQMLLMLESFASLDTAGKAKEQNLNINIYSCEIDNNKAQVKYYINGKDEKLDLIKIRKEWLVDMKKETPAEPDPKELAYQDSLAAVEAAYQDSVDQAQTALEYQQDTMRLFDLSLMDMRDRNGSSVLTFMVNNKCNYDIAHLWFSLYFSDKNGKFMMKKDIMFNNISKYEIPQGDSIPHVSNQSAEIMLEKINLITIGEIFISPLRVDIKYSDTDYDYSDSALTDFLKYQTKLTNASGKDLFMTY